MTGVTRCILLLGVCLLMATGCSVPSPGMPAGTASGIGNLPSFLPTPTVNGLAHGSAASPAMSYAGSPVVVRLATGDVTVDVQGPAFPADTTLGAEQVVCTFTITMRDSDTTVPVAVAEFDVLDHLGGLHPVSASPTPVPAHVDPHQTVTFQLAATVPSGEGLLRYHQAGGAVVAVWDYVAETD